MPAPLELAFGSQNIHIKKKKKKRDSIYPHELQALTDSQILPGEPDSFFPVQKFQRSPQQIKEDQLNKKQEQLEKKEMMLKQQVQYVPKQKEQIYPQRLVISDHDWNEFKRYQQERHNHVIKRKINSVEGFTSINDDFNDVLLFGLFGIIFLIFTDYMYKLGKKSY
jgi:hypothetical protein